ncbi:hypothetical protein GCM10007092_05050 [Thermus composti]|uniref:Uncharacterized protein n=1 Tax=Thermus composti TaxID=532059 RepID=A0ABV6Q3F5_9DEIN|nr:hypothetical protein [Thermus composti]GGM94723.1 hypothetical protein GCM10007092_05050 [Thermus composti]
MRGGLLALSLALALQGLTLPGPRPGKEASLLPQGPVLLLKEEKPSPSPLLPALALPVPTPLRPRPAPLPRPTPQEEAERPRLYLLYSKLLLEGG